MPGDPCDLVFPDPEPEPSRDPYYFWGTSYFIGDEWARWDARITDLHIKYGPPRGVMPMTGDPGDEWARWDASVDSLLALSSEDALALLACFSGPEAFLAEYVSAAELRRLAFARWRLRGADPARRQEWLPSA